MASDGRNNFKLEEDKAMLEFLVEQLKAKPFLSVKGLEIWKEAEKRKITNRTHHSMSGRTKRILLMNLDIQPISHENKEFLKSKLSLGNKTDDTGDSSSNTADEENDDVDRGSEVTYGKRQAFTEKEDVELLSFLVNEIKTHNTSADNPAGKKLWRLAAERKILPRTADSMHTRFSRYLYAKYNELPYVPDTIKQFLNMRMKSKSSKSTAASSSKQRDNFPASSETPKKSNKQRPTLVNGNGDDQSPSKRSTRSDASKGKSANSNINLKSIDSSDDDAAPSRSSSSTKPKRKATNPPNISLRSVDSSDYVSPKKRHLYVYSDDDEAGKASTEKVDIDLKKSANLRVSDRNVEIQRILKDGAHITNDVRFESIVFRHVLKGMLKTSEELETFVQKIRMVEALCYYYDKNFEEIIDLIKSNDNDIRKAECALIKDSEKFLD